MRRYTMQFLMVLKLVTVQAHAFLVKIMLAFETNKLILNYNTVNPMLFNWFGNQFNSQSSTFTLRKAPVHQSGVSIAVYALYDHSTIA